MTELTVTMLPPPRRSISGSAARVVRTAAIRPRVREAYQSSSVTLTNPPGRGETATGVVDQDVDATALRGRCHECQWPVGC